MECIRNFYKGKKVFITGHTGFKGSWLSIWLNKLGAEVIGYSNEVKTDKDNFVLAGLNKKLIDLRGDINDQLLLTSIQKYKPEIVFHLAAQPLVLYSYENPLETYMSNVMGTLNLLEAIKKCESVKSVVVITTDKCYLNNEWCFGYREIDALGGCDPYSSSKACAEIAVDSFRKSYFSDLKRGIATARAGNVIGGGDWSADRIIPDAIRKLSKNEVINVRNPNFIRPWQHVLEPLGGYLVLAMKLYNDPVRYSEAFNFGPKNSEVLDVESIVKKIVHFYGQGNYTTANSETNPHEANTLTLDISKSMHELNWKPKLNIDQAIEMTIEWYKNYDKVDVYELCLNQISYYENFKD